MNFVRVPQPDLQSLLLTRLPQLQQAYDELVSWHPAPGDHLVFGHVLVPHVVSLLDRTNAAAELETVFAIIEEVAQEYIGHGQEVVAVSLLENLTDEKRWVEAAWPFMRSTTRRIFRAVVQAMGLSFHLRKRRLTPRNL